MPMSNVGEDVRSSIDSTWECRISQPHWNIVQNFIMNLSTFVSYDTETILHPGS